MVNHPLRRFLVTPLRRCNANPDAPASDAQPTNPHLRKYPHPRPGMQFPIHFTGRNYPGPGTRAKNPTRAVENMCDALRKCVAPSGHHALAGEFTPAQRIRHATPPRTNGMGIPFPRSVANHPLHRFLVTPLRRCNANPDAPASKAQPHESTSVSASTSAFGNTIPTSLYRAELPGGRAPGLKIPPEQRKTCATHFESASHIAVIVPACVGDEYSAT